MNTPAKKPNPIIAKLAQIMMQIETCIHQSYTQENKIRFIAETAFNLTHMEDHVFSSDQIEKLVKIMVNYHESGVNQWHIDIENSTAEHIDITLAQGQRLQIPANAFIAASAPINSQNNPAPRH